MAVIRCWNKDCDYWDNRDYSDNCGHLIYMMKDCSKAIIRKDAPVKSKNFYIEELGSNGGMLNMQNEEQWTLLGHCKFCRCKIYGKGEERRYMGLSDCNCELPEGKMMTPKAKLLQAIKGAMILGRCPLNPNVMQRLNEQLGKIKSLANDIEERDEKRQTTVA